MVPGVCRVDPVDAGLSGSGPGAGERGADAGPEPGALVYLGAGALLDDPPASVAPGVAGGLRARRNGHHRGHRTAGGAVLALGPIMRGWALAMQGQGAEGLTQLRQGLDVYRATGAAF